jgi:hypothetical protein
MVTGRVVKVQSMTKAEIKVVLDRVLTWPTERQEDAARVLTLMEEQDASPYQLTDEQLAEVERRLAEPNAKSITLTESRRRMRKRGGSTANRIESR